MYEYSWDKQNGIFFAQNTFLLDKTENVAWMVYESDKISFQKFLFTKKYRPSTSRTQGSIP